MRFRNRRTRVPQRNVIGKPFKGILAKEHWVGLPDEDVADLLERGYQPVMLGETTAQNQAAANVVYFPRAIVVSTDQTINQGDCVFWDSVHYTLKVCTTSAAVAVAAGTGGFCGVAAGSNVPGVYPNPPAGTPSENLPGIEVQRGGTAWLYVQSNDVIDYPFQAVTMAGVDAQTVTKGAASSANRVGLVIVPPPATPRGTPGATPAPETIAGGDRVRVWIEPKFPATALV